MNDTNPWGQVLQLTKFDSNLIQLDTENLTVTVCGLPAMSGTSYAIGSLTEFAAVAQESDAGGNISSLAGYYDELKYFIEGVRGEHALERAALADSIGSVRLVQREIETAGGLVLK